MWAATGNNLRVAGDMPRRSYSIRLDANAERPWERTGFKIKGLEQLRASQSWRSALGSAHSDSGLVHQRQTQSIVPTLGSFEEWAETIGSVLAFAGIEGFLGNLEQTQVVQDEDTQQWTAFFDAWWERFEDIPITIDDICHHVITRKDSTDEDVDVSFAEALPDTLLVNRDRGEGSFKRSLGRHLSKFSGRIFGGHKLSNAGMIKKQRLRKWQLEPTATANPETLQEGAGT